MRIAYIIEKLSGKGGMERILIDKMNYLAKYTAHEVVCVLLFRDEQLIAYPLHANVRILRLNCTLGFAPVDFPLMLLRFRKYIKGVDPEITVYTWVAGAFLACYGGWKGTSIYENHHTLSDMKHKWVVRRASKKVDCVVALSDDDAKAFTKARRVEVIPNFTTIEAKKADYSSKHCLAIGRLVDVKDFPRMIEIWKRVSVIHPDWILDIVGEGTDKSKIQNIIERENLQNAVILHSSTSDVVEYYSRSSIYLITSKYEGAPIVLLEARACGLPVVAFDCDFGPRQLITDGKDGYLIPYYDDQSFIEKLSMLIADESLRQKMGEYAKVAASHYQPATVMAQWLNTFGSLVKKDDDKFNTYERSVGNNSCL